MSEEINEFLKLSREIRLNYERFVLSNTAKYCDIAMKRVDDLEKFLPKLLESLLEEKKAVVYHEKEFGELERLLAPQIEKRRKQRQ